MSNLCISYRDNFDDSVVDSDDDSKFDVDDEYVEDKVNKNIEDWCTSTVEELRSWAQAAAMKNDTTILSIKAPIVSTYLTVTFRALSSIMD